jgi:hypothetical protein
MRVINGQYTDVSSVTDVKCPRPPVGPDADGFYSLREREVPWRDVLEIWLPVRAARGAGYGMMGYLDSLSYPGRQIRPRTNFFVSMWASDLQGTYRGVGYAGDGWGAGPKDGATENIQVQIIPTGADTVEVVIRQSLWGYFELDSQGYAKNIEDRGSTTVVLGRLQDFSTNSFNTATNQFVGLNTKWAIGRLRTTTRELYIFHPTQQSIVTSPGGSWGIGAPELHPVA